MSNVTVPNSTNAPLVCEADRYALANMDNRERMRDITGTANRANVSFYPITPMRTSPTSGGAVHLSYVRQMAEDSDGLAIVNTNNIAEPLRRVISDMSSYYLVGYESTNSTLDGRFRTIKVSVKRPNVQVRARKGYRATRAADVASSAAAKSSAPRADEPVARALTSVIGSATPVPLRLRASAWTRGTSGPEGFVWIVGEVDAATRREPGWSSGATAEIAVLGSNGAASERRTVTIGPGGFTFVARVPEAGTLPPDQYMVRVSLRSSGSGSTVADATTTTVPASASPLGEPLLLRRSPSTGTRYIETADQRFARNERLRVELPAASKDTAVARVVDRAGQTMKVPAQVSSRGDASGDFQWVVVDLALAPFAPGDYAVVVSLESAMQVIGFRVVP
jgi:hypothetical protein